MKKIFLFIFLTFLIFPNLSYAESKIENMSESNYKVCSYEIKVVGYDPVLDFEYIKNSSGELELNINRKNFGLYYEPGLRLYYLNKFKKDKVCPDIKIISTKSSFSGYALVKTNYDEEGFEYKLVEEKGTLNIENMNDEKPSDDESDSKCESFFGKMDDAGNFEEDSLGYVLSWIFSIIKYVAIAILIVLSGFDFFLAMVKDDKSAIKKASMTALKRLVFSIMIFFLPILLEVLMKIVGASGTCGIG